ncbi:hypothetical protein [Paenibacillus albidus]|uniref:hypothetical protein n=1 Tax=Paenibacillus albidus TaxID=2041023 RepID=UPI00166CB9E1|nr:hypothetical protein [Paenibacillus albidus]
MSGLAALCAAKSLSTALKGGFPEIPLHKMQQNSDRGALRVILLHFMQQNQSSRRAAPPIPPTPRQLRPLLRTTTAHAPNDSRPAG